MKYLVVIGDGMADNPVEALGGKTPLEYADIPTIDSLAARGKGINGGNVGVLERRFAAEGLDGVVRHAVADDNKIFHRSASLSDDECSIAGEWAKIKDKSPRAAEFSLLNGKRTGYPVRFVRFDDLNSLDSPMLSACGRDNRRERRVRCCACRSAVRARSRAGKGMQE